MQLWENCRLCNTVITIYLVSTCCAEIVEDWQEQINSNRRRDSIADVDGNKLSAELIILIGNAKQCDCWHEACHQRKGHGPDLKIIRKVNEGDLCTCVGFSMVFMPPCFGLRGEIHRQISGDVWTWRSWNHKTAIKFIHHITILWTHSPIPTLISRLKAKTAKSKIPKTIFDLNREIDERSIKIDWDQLRKFCNRLRKVYLKKSQKNLH